MNDDRKIPLVSVLILVVVIVTAVAFFLLRKTSLVSPLPQNGEVQVIFTSPPPTEAPTIEPSATGEAKKTTPTVAKKPTASVTPTKTVTPFPTPVEEEDGGGGGIDQEVQDAQELGE